MSAPAIRATGLAKSYGAVRALRGLDLTVAPGEVVSYLGPNGSGKTTTIRLLLGLARPDAAGPRSSAWTASGRRWRRTAGSPTWRGR